MRRDYIFFIDSTYDGHNKDKDFCEAMKDEIRKTIKEDPIDDAVENIMNLILETKYEW